MRALSRNNIVDVFVWVDDAVASYPTQSKPGVRSVLTDSELTTILIWDSLTEPHKTLRAMYDWITREYQDCFPKLPRYQNFVAHTHRILPLLARLLSQTLSTATPLRFVDSTMLPVCRLIRADRHKVARGIATFGKLKEHCFLVSSFPRSVQGYALHYVRTLLGYQMRANS